MSGVAQSETAASRERQALAAIRTLRARLDGIVRARKEPIAIVGLSCRLPTAVTDVASYWDLLSNGRDAVRPIPAERIDLEPVFKSRLETPDRSYACCAGLVEGVDAFDA